MVLYNICKAVLTLSCLISTKPHIPVSTLQILKPGFPPPSAWLKPGSDNPIQVHKPILPSSHGRKLITLQGMCPVSKSIFQVAKAVTVDSYYPQNIAYTQYFFNIQVSTEK